MEDFYDKMRTQCWAKAMEATGASYVYQKRTKRLNFWLTWSKTTGFILPVLLGGIVANYSEKGEIIKYSLLFATPVAIAQLVLSAILTAQNIDANYAKYVSLSIKNLMLSVDFKELANFPPATLEELRPKFMTLVKRERALQEDDVDLTDKENRKGKRYGLYTFQFDCAGCGITPKSMIATKCDVCGNF